MTPLARIHLDPIGGLAGDMFAAALADAFPQMVPGLMAELAKLRPGPRGGDDEARIRFLPHTDAILRGLRFEVDAGPHHHAPHGHAHGEAHAHLHVPHRRIREQLAAAKLQPQVLEHALALFQLLAEAEGEVHGIAPEEVEFHEVGAFDSIVDFVAAAFFIANLAPARWSIGALPLGGGRVKTAHGVLPVPAPATTLLLQGLEVIDDGVGGERVTPTGAAIARYLHRGQTLYFTDGNVPASEKKSLSPVVVAAVGNGFGTRTLAGMPNVVRCIAFAPASEVPAPLDEDIATITFEVDDQTAEDLAVAIERIREAPGVLDASQVAVYGKKNRLATQVQVLARPGAADAVADLCLAQTTTLGVRIARAWRRTLPRAMVETSGGIRVKVAERPGGKPTAKAEMEDIARVAGDRSQRQEARTRAESQALDMTRIHEPHDRRDD
jgi:pyridinium-3,5-bisthiocarboxylic acid mononucleotide nickel chelatase